MQRRALNLALLGALSSIAWPQLASAVAAPFPTRVVTIVVPNAPGGAIDILARLLQEQLQTLWGQTVLVVYKPGAGTVVGTAYVAKSKPDGYTLGMVITGHMINPSLRKNMPFDTLKDLSGVTLLATSPIVLSATPDLPANTLAEVIALAKKEPGRLSYASAGTGSSMHLAGEMLKTMAGIDMVHVPFNGAGPAYPEVFSGRVPLLLDPLFSSLPHIKSGRMKPIAILSAKRSAIAPNIPTAAETLPGYVVESVFGMVAPSGTPPELIRKIRDDLAKVLETPHMKERLAEIALSPVGDTPEEFDAIIRADIAKWAGVVKASGVTAE